MRHIQYSILLLICLTVLFASFVGAQEKRSNDLFQIKLNGKYGFIDKTGKVVIEPKFDAVSDFSEDLAAVRIENNLWGFIDKSGNWTIKPQFSWAYNFSEDLARVQVNGDKYGDYGKWGFIDKSGKFIIEPQFEDKLTGVAEASQGFHEGLAMIEVNYLKGFINKEGKIVIKPQFRYGYHFVDGLACVTKELNSKWGYIDKSGKWTIPPKFEDASSLVKIGLT